MSNDPNADPQTSPDRIARREGRLVSREQRRRKRLRRERVEQEMHATLSAMTDEDLDSLASESTQDSLHNLARQLRKKRRRERRDLLMARMKKMTLDELSGLSNFDIEAIDRRAIFRRLTAYSTQSLETFLRNCRSTTLQQAVVDLVLKRQNVERRKADRHRQEELEKMPTSELEVLMSGSEDTSTIKQVLTAKLRNECRAMTTQQLLVLVDQDDSLKSEVARQVLLGRSNSPHMSNSVSEELVDDSLRPPWV